MGVKATIELVADVRATLGEGPVWDGARGVLWWVDILAGRLHRFDPRSGDDSVIEVGSLIGAVALRRDGSLVAAVVEGILALDPDGSSSPRLVLPLGAPDDGLRCNDAKCDPAGRLWVGRMSRQTDPGAGCLLRVEPDLSVTTVLSDLTIPNGLGWSADGHTMYFTDSTWREVRAYAYEPRTGALGEGRTLLALGPDDGVPDGLTVDAEDHVWVARWGAGRVDRVAPDGRVVDRVELPAAQATSCTFGGPDLGDLYITTARERFSPEDEAREPQAGGLFRCRPGVHGVPPVPFAG